MTDVSIEEFFLSRAEHIEEERQLFARFVRLVAPSETELLSLSWDERSASFCFAYTYIDAFVFLGALKMSIRRWNPT